MSFRLATNDEPQTMAMGDRLERRSAYLEMNGRFFGGRQIAASFYKEDKFDALDLEPQPDEEK